MAKDVEFYGGQLDGAILQNAATEETLKQLVAAISGKAPSGGGSSSGILGRTPAGMIAGGVVGAVTGAVKGAVNQIGNVTGAAGTFAGMLLKGEGRISSYTKVLNNQVISQLPIFGRALGTVGGAISGSIEAFEHWNKTLMGLTTSGATFNNSILEMMQVSNLTYMSLDEFAGMVNKNSKTLMALGDSVTQGAHAFAKVSDAALNGSGEARKQLISLGYTVPQINQQLLDFMNLNYRGSRVDETTAKSVADSFVGYQVNLHTLTTLTGKRVDQIQAELDSATKDAAYQLEIAKYSNDSRKELNLQLANYTQIHGDVGARLFRARTLGLMAQGDDVAELIMMYPNLIKQMDQNIAMAKNNAASGKLLDRRIIQTRTDLIWNASKGLKNFDILLKAAAAGDKDLQRMLGMNAETASLVARLGVGTKITSREQLRLAIEKNYLETKEKETFTETMRQFQVAIRDFKRGFFMALIGTKDNKGPLWQFSESMKDENLPKKIRELGQKMGVFAQEAVPKMIMFFARFGTQEGRDLYWLEIKKLFEKIKLIAGFHFENAFRDDDKQLPTSHLNNLLEGVNAEYDPQIKEQTKKANAAVVQMIDGFDGRTTPTQTDFSSAAYAGNDQEQRAIMVYRSFINAGFSPKLAKVLTAEVFRENSLRSNYLLGSHTDPKNKKTNYGMFSWQGDRANAYKAYMGGQLNDTDLSLSNLSRQASFAASEIMSGQYGPEVINAFKNPDQYTSAELHRLFGEKYIKWAIDHPDYASKGNMNLVSGHGILDRAMNKYSIKPKRTGNLGGMAGTLFENFGSGETIETHGNEVIQSPGEFVNDMSAAATEAGGNISQLNENLKILLSLEQERVNLANRLLDNQARKSTSIYAIAGGVA